jgi:uncharacterized protein (DUF1684 family)
MTASSNRNAPEQYNSEMKNWHKTMDASLQTEYGWLSVVGLHWLNEGVNSLGGDPSSDVALPVNSAPATVGVLTLENGQVRLSVTNDETVFVDGSPVTEIILRDDNDEAGASEVKIRNLTFQILKRGDAYGVRVRDPQSPARASFSGRNWFPVDPAYRVVGTFHPYDGVQSIEVDNILGTVTTLKGVGYVTFELGGQAQKLIAFDGGVGKLWFIFRDTTSGQATYGSGRFLMADLSADGTVDLDFNKAYNPPCAFTPYATCPLPPRENHLTLPISAGEKVLSS